MHRAKMRATAVDYFSFYDTPAVWFSAFFACAPVGFVMQLELPGQAVYVPIVRH